MCSHPASSRPGPADRYAPSGLPFPPLRGGPLTLVKPRTATPVRRPRTASQQGNTSLQDRRVLPQGQAAAPPAWTGGVDNRITRTLSNIHLQQEQPTTIPAWPYGVYKGYSRMTPINTKKSLRTISRLKTLSKHGGFLLSHLVWQYHRR